MALFTLFLGILCFVAGGFCLGFFGINFVGSVMARNFKIGLLTFTGFALSTVLFLYGVSYMIDSAVALLL